jgi:hypothetical protein
MADKSQFMASLQSKLAEGIAKMNDQTPKGDPVFYTLPLSEDQQFFYPKSSPKEGINIKDRHAVNGALNAFKFWNRYDLVDDLVRFINDHGDKAPMNASGALRTAPDTISRIGERGAFDWTPEQLCSGCRALSQGPGTLTVHRGSAIAFLLSLVGNGLTGIVKLAPEKPGPRTVRPKIFLVPIQPSVSNKGSVYPVRPHLKGMTTNVYKVPLEPITHQQTGMGQASHTQLSDAIKSNKKYADLAQEKGDFVGFTVIKGDGKRGVRNRYGFTSASSNTHSFRIGETMKHTNCTTEEWGVSLHWRATSCSSWMQTTSIASLF